MFEWIIAPNASHRKHVKKNPLTRNDLLGRTTLVYQDVDEK